MPKTERPRPLKTRKGCRWVWLSDVPQGVRTKAAHIVIRNEPAMTSEARVELMLLAMNPGDAGGWVAA